MSSLEWYKSLLLLYVQVEVYQNVLVIYNQTMITCYYFKESFLKKQKEFWN